MSDDPTPVTRTISPYWALLLLPAALVVVWLIHNAPIPDAPVRQHVEARSAPQAAVAPSPSRPKVADPARVEAEPPAWYPTPAAAPPKPEAPRPNVSDWTSLELATIESQSNGKPVLLDFNAEWCGPCRRLKSEVFDDAALGRAVQTAVIPVSIVDRARENGQNPAETEALQQRFGVDAFPTLVVFMPNTGRAAKAVGYRGPQGTLDWITEAAQSVR